MKQPTSIPVKFETEQYHAIKRSVSERYKNKSDVVREATRIGLPWLENPPKNTIAKETLEGLAILHGGISLFTREVTAVGQLVNKQEKLLGTDALAFAPLIVRIGKIIQKAEVLLASIENRSSQLTSLRPMPHSVLLKLKTLAEQENERLLDGDPDRLALTDLIRTLDEMGVA